MLRSWLYSVGGLLLFLLLSYAAITWGLPLIVPFVIAALLAQLVNPFVEALTSPKLRWLRLPRSLASALILAAVAALAALGVTMAALRLVHELTVLVEELPTYYVSLQSLADRLVTELAQVSDSLPEPLRLFLNDLLSDVYSLLSDLLPDVAASLGALAMVPELFIDTLILLVATYFISRDRYLIGRFLISLVPAPARSRVVAVKNQVWESAVGFARAQVLLMGSTAALTAAGLSFVGVDYAVLMGILVGLSEVIPVVGTGLVFTPWVILQIALGNWALAGKLILLWLIGVVARQILEPKLLADNTGLHPLATLISIYLGITFFGPLGFVIGPLLTILLRALVRTGLLPIFPRT